MGVILEGEAWSPKGIVSTGSLLLDSCFKFGGIPTGSIVQYYTPTENEGAFKSTLGLCGLAEFQKLGYKVGGVDAELTPWDKDWLEGKGIVVDDKKLWVSARSLNGEDAINDVTTLVKDLGVKALLFDSIDYARPESYHDSDPGDANMGTHAKLMRQLWQKFKDYGENYNVTSFVINQAGNKVGTMPWQKGERMAGGRASRYAPTVNVRMKRPSDSKLFDVDLIPIKMQVKRSKLGGSWKKFTTYFVQGQGVDRPSELLVLGMQGGVCKPSNKTKFKKGNKTAWYFLNDKGEKDKKIGKDFVSARNWVFDNEEEFLEILRGVDSLKHIKGIQGD